LALTASKTGAGPAAKAAPAEFESLFQEHWGRICRLLLGLVGDRAEAEDLALEAFWRLYQRPPAQAQNLPGWLYRVATNLGYNALRAQKRRGRYETAVLSEAAPDPAQQAEAAEQQRRVRRALAEISPRSARLLALRYSGLSYAEVAAALKLSPGSVGTLLARAEAEFRQKYAKLEQGA
jgi:RNA polymerase sigma-70 factor (ECF subfamily)